MCLPLLLFVERCHLLQASLDLTKWHLFGMLVNVTASETPDCLWQITQETLNSRFLIYAMVTLGFPIHGVSGLLYHCSIWAF